ncbi:hypothetical protein BH20ACT5_BH20ACT5_19490 [soil metagenome]
MVSTHTRRQRAPLVAVGIAAVVILLTALAGQLLVTGGARLHLLGGLIIRGPWEPRPGVSMLLPLAVGGLLLVAAPAWSQRLSWAALLPASALAAAGWAVSLALVDGVSGLTKPLSSRYEYPYDVPRVGSWGEFLDGFTGNILADSPDPWTTHVAGHPPGALLTFAGLDQIGLGGLGWAAALCVVVGASAVPAALVATRATVDEATARVIAPFVAVAPLAIWVAVSADAIFLGVSAWGIAALAVATRRDGVAADLLALAGGLLLGTALFLSYGLVLLGPLALAVIAVRRRWRVLLVGALGVLAVLLIFAAAGFWWFDGLLTTAERVTGGPAARNRPTPYFLVANLAASAIAIGPAGVGAVGALLTRDGRRTPVALLAFGGLAAILIADFSLLSKGEVERIYLPFLLWILTATALLEPRQRSRWLAAQIVVAIAVQVLIRTEW